MGIAKRVFLFIATNLAILITVSIITSLLGIQPYLTSRGIDYQALMAFCLVWGFAGSFISLAISKMIAKWSMGVKVIDPQSASGEAAWLVERVHSYARDAGISKMPEVGVYNSPEPNAFATGPTKNRSLVAVSTGLLQTMRKEEVEGVLAHEVAHIANGDMVTMTLIQGIVNAFVMFFARIVAHVISMNVRDEMRPMVHLISVIAFDIIFGILGSMIVATFSRWREYRADAGAAQLAGREKMIGALERLRQVFHPDPQDNHAAYAPLKIAGKKSGGFWALLMTHPPLEKRIAALRS